MQIRHFPKIFCATTGWPQRVGDNSRSSCKGELCCVVTKFSSKESDFDGPIHTPVPLTIHHDVMCWYHAHHYRAYMIESGCISSEVIF